MSSHESAANARFWWGVQAFAFFLCFSAPALAQQGPDGVDPSGVTGERVHVVLKSGREVRGTLLDSEGRNYRIERAPGDVLILPKSFVSSINETTRKPEPEPERVSTPGRDPEGTPEAASPGETLEEVAEPEVDPQVTVVLESGFEVRGIVRVGKDGVVRVERGPGDVIVLPEHVVASIDGEPVRPTSTLEAGGDASESTTAIAAGRDEQDEERAREAEVCASPSEPVRADIPAGALKVPEPKRIRLTESRSGTRRASSLRASSVNPQASWVGWGSSCLGGACPSRARRRSRCLI